MSSWFGKEEAASAAPSDKEKLEQLRASSERLLNYCASQQLDVPDDIKKNILREEHEGSEVRASVKDFLDSLKSIRDEELEESDVVKEIAGYSRKLQLQHPHLDLRVVDGKYEVTNYFDDDDEPDEEEDGPRRAKQKIPTVRSESPLYKFFRMIRRCIKNRGDISLRRQDTIIMEGVNLVFEPGKMYLVLGAPGSGKSTLLKMIAKNLHVTKNHRQSGTVSLSGVTQSDQLVWSSLVSFMDQIDRLHPYLTVFETCEFAWRCRSGGTHRRRWHGEGPEVDETIKQMDGELTLVHKVLEALGLARVKDTFVGDQDQVRGVSGGEKKRVTVAEMLCVSTPVLCCDEISTGLDAATTYDITRFLGTVTRMNKTIQIVSLLQPPPETVANFDELAVLSNGKVIYFGPLEEVLDHFNSLGYEIPERMDVADWLQAIPTKEGARFLKGAEAGEGDEEVETPKHMTTDEFVEAFNKSPRGQAIVEKLQEPSNNPEAAQIIKEIGSAKYANSWYGSLKLLCRRELLLWWRDKYQIKAKIMQTLIMGVVAGTLFWQTDDPNSIVSIIFQSMFYSALAQMTLITKQFPFRSIFYKHQDAKFFPTWSYVIGRSIATVPIAASDGLFYGTMIYFMVGLSFKNEATFANYFVFLLTVFLISLTTGLFFSMYSAAVKVVTIAQACMALTAVMFVLFSGFTVQPDVIPVYWEWFYWLNFFAWDMRALVVNEFQSGAWDDMVPAADPPATQGEVILDRFGFSLNGEVFGYAWVWYGILFTCGIAIFSTMGSMFLLNHIRFITGGSLITDPGSDEEEKVDESQEIAIPFTRVDLTFKDMHYTVQSSITNEQLELLKGIDGAVEAGKMSALMGSSGAGKTTLMDVLAMRKTSGEITGEICLNGHPQEEMSFRRCTGYVEQFDQQTPQLTIRETMMFSAKLRLEETDPAVTEESVKKFVDQTLAMLELTNEQDLQVGSDATGGLSFEQKKRLSIGVELVANPSILFLDEPTSGLDARAALIVMRGLKRIAKSGRAVCATIHQPSIAIFQDFDSLLLLKRGGEVVFCGELGEESCKLIEYLERFDATPKIQPGENPATWMLTTIGAGSAGTDKKPFDYAGSYIVSKLHAQGLELIDKICAGATDENRVSFPSKFATSRGVQAHAVMLRTLTVYFRSPSYNVVRLIVSLTIALLFASVYASERVPKNESDMNSRVNSIFIAVLFLSVNANNTVLAVFEFERNMFYRHKAANMYGSRAIVRAFTLAELPFIFTAATVFTLPFYFIMGFAIEADHFFWFYLYVFLTLGLFTFLGHMLVSLLRDSQTAQGFGALVVAFSSLFGGVLIKASEIPNFWLFMYWIFPGHYFLEGLVMSQFADDDSTIEASVGSPYYQSLVADETCQPEQDPCYGTIGQWIDVTFTDWNKDDVVWNIIYLIGFIILSRLISFYALTNINYRAT